MPVHNLKCMFFSVCETYHSQFWDTLLMFIGRQDIFSPCNWTWYFFLWKTTGMQYYFKFL